MTTNTRPLPTNKDAEESLVGSVLIHPPLYGEYSHITPDTFHERRLGKIWESVARLYLSGCSIDIVTLLDDLERHQETRNVGGAAYLTQLINNVPSSLNAGNYAEIVTANAVRRRIIIAASTIARMGYDEATPIREVMEGAQTALESAGDGHITGQVHDMKTVLSQVYDDIDERSRSGKKGRHIIQTGLIDLDRILKMRKGDMIILAGRPSTGKTGLACTITLHNILSGKHVAFFTLEMSEEEIVERLIAQYSGCNGQRITDGELRENEWPMFAKAVEDLGVDTLHICDNSSITVPGIRAECMRLKARGNLDFVVVDYIQLMGMIDKTENRAQEVAAMSRGLKIMARKLEVPVLAASQLNRAVEQRGNPEPQLSDLKESGGLEQDADAVVFLYLPKDLDGVIKATTLTPIQIKVAKQRKGAVGVITAVRRDETTKFESASLTNVPLMSTFDIPTSYTDI